MTLEREIFRGQIEGADGWAEDCKHPKFDMKQGYTSILYLRSSDLYLSPVTFAVNDTVGYRDLPLAKADDGATVSESIDE